jgi:hypothetical protein
LALAARSALKASDVLLLGVVAVVVVFIHQPAVAHPGIGGHGLGRCPLRPASFFRQAASQPSRRDSAVSIAACVQAFDAHHARVIAQALVQLAVAHVHANDLGGTVLQQAVGEAAGALPTSRQRKPLTTSPSPRRLRA